MKLAEALLLRADLQKKLQSLRERTVANAVVQDGTTPSEDPNDLLRTAIACIAQLEALVVQINLANLVTALPDGRTLTTALAQRDGLKQHHALLIAAIAGSRQDPARYGVREIKWVPQLEVAKLQRQADDVARRLRELDGQIQQANWAGEVTVA